MKAWLVHAWGEPESMRFAEVAVPGPAAGQVRIRNRAAALNFFDILQIQGKYQIKPAFPFTPGAEVAGLVDAVGAGVEGFVEGHPVLAFTFGGGFAEYTLADAVKVFPLPRGMNFNEAAAMPIVYHTSLFALEERAALRAHEWLLVHAGASGVGVSAIQIGRAMGARVIAAAGSREKLEFCLEQGAQHVINYRDEGWVEVVREITQGHGADVIYDPVGGDVFDLSTKCIAPEGRLLIIGFTSGRIPAIQANRILLKNMSVVGVFWGNFAQRHPDYLARSQARLAAMYQGRQIHPVVGRAYPLDAAPAALRDLAERKLMGKAVLVMD